jgi:hypothetical protein
MSLSRFAPQQAKSAGTSSTKRKNDNEAGSSRKKTRDNRMGMFTPPSFNLGVSSDENSQDASQIDGISTQEDCMPQFAIDAQPLAWSDSTGTLVLLFMWLLSSSYFCGFFICVYL